MAREREEFTPPVRIHPSGSHLVIYRREGQGVEIIRVHDVGAVNDALLAWRSVSERA